MMILCAMTKWFNKTVPAFTDCRLLSLFDSSEDNVFGSIAMWDCISATKFTLSFSLSLSISHNPVDQFVCTTPAVADIVILVDGSWSIGRINFRLVRMFLENLVSAFDVGIDKTRIGGSHEFTLIHS